MGKTIKQIADELNIDKQRVYRYIKKNHINEAHQKNGVMYYDEAAESLIKQGFFQKSVSNEAHHEAHQNHINEAVVDALRKELEIKNKQIEQLNNQVAQLTVALENTTAALTAAQALHAADKKQVLIEAEAQQEAPERRHWWQRKKK